MSMTTDYPRDLIGYGRDLPEVRWPGQARVAVQFVLNYEEGGEHCLLDGLLLEQRRHRGQAGSQSGRKRWPADASTILCTY